MRSVLALLFVAGLAVVAGCKQRAPSVYVLESPQSVELISSASASKVRQGETVVLHVERRTTGRWKQIPRDELTRGQCWVYRPPVEVEPEVANSVEWQVLPENAVRLHAEYQMDHTIVVTMAAKGAITLTPVSPVKCEEERRVVGPPIEIEVS